MVPSQSADADCADGVALLVALEMPDGWGTGKTSTAAQVSTAAKSAAQAVATTYRVGEQAAAYLDTTRDLRFGQRTKNTNGAWVETLGTSPYNMVKVTIHRDQQLAGTTATRGDQQLPLFFAPVLSTGQKSALLTAMGTAALSPGNGFYISPGSGRTCPLLPFAMDETTWNNLINNGIGSDNYCYSTGGGSGCHPNPNGTVTSGLLPLSGNTGISAGVKDDLAAIIGQPRAIPIFRPVAGPGNNATYQICKFVGVRILYVNLTCSPSQKKVVVQPAPVFDSSIIGTPGAMQTDSIMTSLKLIH